MAATFDATAGVQTFHGDATTLTFSVSITPSVAGSTVFLVVSMDSSDGEAYDGTPTCGGVNMTEVGTVESATSVLLRVHRLENQPASAVTVAMPAGAIHGPASGTAQAHYTAKVFCVNGANTTNAIGTVNAQEALTSPYSQAQTGGANDLLIGIASLADSAFGDPSGGTMSPGAVRIDEYFPASGEQVWIGMQTAAGTGSSQTLSWTPNNGYASNMAIKTFNVVGAAGGGGAALAAALTGTAAVAGALTTAIHAAAALTGTGAVGASLTTAIRAATSLVGTGALAASLSTGIPLAAGLTGSASVTADLTAGGTATRARRATLFGDTLTRDPRPRMRREQLRARESLFVVAYQAVSTDTGLFAALTGTGSASASLTTGIPLASALTGTATTTAALSTGIPLAAGLTGTGTLAGALTSGIRLAAGLTGTGAVAATFAGSPAVLGASLVGSGSAAGALTTQIPLAAGLSGTGAVAAALQTGIALSAALAGSATLTVVSGEPGWIRATVATTPAVTARVALEAAVDASPGVDITQA